MNSDELRDYGNVIRSMITDENTLTNGRMG